MNNNILNFLEKITDEEAKILSKNKTLNKNIYTNNKDFHIVEADKLLRPGNLISVRTHTRFIDFPAHKHDYVEMIYIIKGSMTNIINGQELVLTNGDLLFLNCNLFHSIKSCTKNDVAINFIIKPNFFDEALSMLEKNNYISNFISDTLRNKNTNGQFLLFKTEGILTIENIIENIIYSIISNKSLNEININKKSMGILFMYLSYYTFMLENNSKINNNKEMMKNIIKNYIETTYKTATLSEISKHFNSSIFKINRFIKMEFGQTFKKILQEKRFTMAQQFLRKTNLSVIDIMNNVGYENSSYFYKKFKEFFNLSPAEYRKKYIEKDIFK